MRQLDGALCQFQLPMCLSGFELLWRSEVREVEVIGIDQSFMGASLDVVAPLVKCSNDSQEFSVVDLVIPFGGGEGLR